MKYDIEISKEIDGFKIVVIKTTMGHRCGYVGLPGDHPFVGVEYHMPIPGYDRKDIEELPVGDRGIVSIFVFANSGSNDISPEILFDVHGGITFSSYNSKGYPIPTPSPVWWYGFDCAHLDDTPEEWTTEAVEKESVRFMEQLAGFHPKEVPHV